MSLPVSRSIGRALVVGNRPTREQSVQTLQQIGYECVELDDPYAAMVELCRRRFNYGALILSLNSLFREELQIIWTVKRRFPHLEVWLSQTTGREAALLEALKLGAEGLLGQEGFHRFAPPAPIAEAPMTLVPASDDGPLAPQSLFISRETHTNDDAVRESLPQSEPLAPGEPVLTADELRALLQDQPTLPPSGEDD